MRPLATRVSWPLYPPGINAFELRYDLARDGPAADDTAGDDTAADDTAADDTAADDTAADDTAADDSMGEHRRDDAAAAGYRCDFDSAPSAARRAAPDTL